MKIKSILLFAVLFFGFKCWGQLVLKSEFNRQINSGSIIVSIPEGQSNGPFTYVISKGPMYPELLDVCKSIDDLVGEISFDVEGFVKGKTSELNFRRDGLSLGVYSVGVYNRDGVLIYDDEIKVYPEFNAIENNNTEYIDGFVNTLKDDASLKLDLILRPNYHSNGASLGFEVTHDQEYYIGLVEEFKEVSSPDRMVLSLRKNESKVEVYLFGDLVYSYDEELTIGDDFEIKYHNKRFFLIKNQRFLLWNRRFDFESDLVLGVGSMFSNVSIPLILNNLFIPFTLNYSNTDSDCELGKSRLVLDFAGVIGAGVIGNDYNVWLKDLEGNVVEYNQTDIPNLSAGIYQVQVSGDYLGHSYSSNFTIYSGVMCGFYQSNQVDLGTTGNSVIGDYGIAPPETGEALGSNILGSNQPGWVKFKIAQNIDQFYFELGLTSNPDYGAPGYPNYQSKFSIYKLGQNQGTIIVPDVNQVFVNPNMEIVIKRDGQGYLEILQGSSLIYSGIVSDQRWFVWLRQLGDFEGVEDVVTSFKCASGSEVYAETTYEMNGFYHVVNDGKLRFVYEEEYNSANQLKFNIYNDRNDVVKTQANYAAINTKLGDNYLTVDLSNLGGYSNNGFYYLEIINEKKEKKYLRFYLINKGGGGIFTPNDVYNNYPEIFIGH